VAAARCVKGFLYGVYGCPPYSVYCVNWSVKIGIMQVDRVFQHLEHAKNNLPSIFLCQFVLSEPPKHQWQSLSSPFGVAAGPKWLVAGGGKS
jgi:hypothetical protein